MSHTPGPWIVGSRLDGDNCIKVGVPIAKEDTILQAVAYVAPRPHYELNNPQRANTRLIAAAPELLEAAKDALESLRRLPDREGAFRVTCVKQLEDAIAKAEGREGG